MTGRVVWGATAAYVALLTAASIDRHLTFESSAYDLGIFDQAIWLLGHGHAPFSTVRGRDLFADHVQPALALFAPLGALDLTPTALLVVQSALLAAAAPALYVLARRLEVGRWLAAAVAIMWLASPVTQWVNLFDFHPETAVPVLLVLCALELERRRSWGFLALAAAAMCFKEDVSLVFIAWGLLLAWQGRRRLGLWLAAGSAVWFVFATTVVIPALGGNLDFYSARFGGERGSLGGVLRAVVTDPVDTFGDLATRQNLHVVLALVVVTGGLALLAPAQLLPAAGPLAANLLSAYSYQHDLHFHYYVVPAAVFAIASAHGASVLEGRGWRFARAAPAVLLAGSLVVTLAGPAVEELRTPGLPTQDAREAAVALVPNDASVAAAPNLVSHLSRRRDVYLLPEPFFTRPYNGEYWSDAELARRADRVEWVVYELAGLDPYLEDQVRTLPPLLAARGFEQVYDREGVRVFRRR